jgi:hypothetical protein
MAAEQQHQGHGLRQIGIRVAACKSYRCSLQEQRRQQRRRIAATAELRLPRRIRTDRHDISPLLDNHPKINEVPTAIPPTKAGRAIRRGLLVTGLPSERDLPAPARPLRLFRLRLFMRGQARRLVIVGRIEFGTTTGELAFAGRFAGPIAVSLFSNAGTLYATPLKAVIASLETTTAVKRNALMGNRRQIGT